MYVNSITLTRNRFLKLQTFLKSMKNMQIFVSYSHILTFTYSHVLICLVFIFFNCFTRLKSEYKNHEFSRVLAKTLV